MTVTPITQTQLKKGDFVKVFNTWGGKIIQGKIAVITNTKILVTPGNVPTDCQQLVSDNITVGRLP